MTSAGWVYGIKIAATSGASWKVYQKAWMDDREITWEDSDEIAAYVMAMGMIWGPELAMVAGISSTPLLVVEAAVAVGLVASIAIGGLEGGETYIEYITEPFSDPVTFFGDEGKTDALMQASDIALSVINPLYIPQKKLSTWIVEEFPWNELLRNRWMTGPLLSF